MAQADTPATPEQQVAHDAATTGMGTSAGGLPTAEEAFGPPPAAHEGKLPTAEEAFGPPPTPQSFGFPNEGALWTGEDADQFYAQAEPIGRVLRAFGQGAEEAWDSGKNLGFSDDINEFMKKAGIYNDVAKGQGNWLKTYNEAIIRPAVAAVFGVPAAIFRGVGAGFTAGFMGAGQVAEEAGQPQLAQDIRAFPEAFPEFGFSHGVRVIPEMHDVTQLTEGARVAASNLRSAVAGAAMRMGPLSVPEVEQAARFGVIGPLGRAGWDGTAVYPTEHFPAGSSVRYGGAVDASQESIPAQFNLEPPRDIHEAARRVAPDVFQEYDALAAQKDALRARIDAEATALREGAEGQAPNAQEIADLERRMETATPRLAKKYAARLEALRPSHEDFLADQFTMGALTRETPEMQAARQEIQEADYRMRDLAPQVTAAYRTAADRYPGTQGAMEEPVQPVVPPVVQPVAAAAPAPEVAPQVAEGPRPAGPAPEGTEPPKFDIAADVSKKLVAAGRPQAEADAAGQLIASHYAARAARFGGAKGTGEDLYRAEAPDIRAPRPKPAPAPGRIRSIADIQAQEKVSARAAKRIQDEEILARAARPPAPTAPAPRQPETAAVLPGVTRETPLQPEVTPGVATTAEHAALEAALARARPVSAEEVAARRERVRNPVLEKLVETVGAAKDEAPEQVFDDIVERLPETLVAEEEHAAADAAETEYREAEREAKEVEP